MGIFESAFNDPETIGLLAAASGMLQAGGPSRVPVGLGQALGQGFMGGLQGYQSALKARSDAEDRKRELRLMDMKIKQYEDDASDKQKVRDFYGNISQFMPSQASQALAAGARLGSVGPTVANAGLIDKMPKQAFNSNAMYEAMLRSGSPALAQMGLQGLSKEDESIVVGEGGALVNKRTGQSLFNNPKPEKLPDGMRMGANGPEWIPGYISGKSEIGRAGAARTNIAVNTEKSLLNDIAGGLGKSLVDSRGQAQGAVNTIQTLGRLNDVITSGKLLAGPGSTFKQFGLQVGNQLGLVGKDATETLTNTRQAVQSLAQLELDAAQAMRGQGAITESERGIIRRAAAGDIDSMTKAEMGTLVNVLDKVSRAKIKSYQSQVAPLKSNPNAAPIAPFLDVNEPAPLQTAPAGAGIKFVGFE